MSAAEMATSKKPAKGKADGKTSKSGGKASAAKGGDKSAEAPKRKLGLRGAAPWAARHAAKHAAEARARAAEPPLPGSARATIRTPVMAEDIKAFTPQSAAWNEGQQLRISNKCTSMIAL